MAESQPSIKSNKDLIFLVALLAAGIVFFNLWMATTNHDNSRDQHLGGAVDYAKGHIDLLRPMLLGFNANGAPSPLEFPIWQALTAVLMKCFGIWYGWGNVVSLIFLFSSLWALFDLCRRLNSVRTAWWVLLFSLIQPLNFIIGGQAGGDSTAWVFAMWFLYFSYRMMNEGKWKWWLLAVFAGGLSAATKAPFFMTAGLTAFFWLWLRYRKSGRAWAFLISAGGISMLLFLAWNSHCHHVYAEAEFPTINMDPLDKKGDINHWYFGTLAYRLSAHHWARGGWHMVTGVFGGLGLVFLPLISTRIRKSAEAWLWVLSAVCTTLVFTPLILEHLHYFFVFGPAIAWLCALGAAEIEPGIWNHLRVTTWARAAILLVTIAASLAGTLMIIHINMYFDPYMEEVGKTIKQHTAPEDKIIVWGMVWGDPFLRADRQGVTGSLVQTNTGWLNDPEKLQRLKQLGYKEIVMINPSPFIVALTSVNGKHGETIVDLHECLPSVAKNWPVIFDSSAVLIVRIPD
jgi:hypothetical protein